MICLFCTLNCPDAGIVDGPGCCDSYPDRLLTDDQRARLEDEWREEEERREEEEMLIERGICPHCGRELHPAP